MPEKKLPAHRLGPAAAKARYEALNQQAAGFINDFQRFTNTKELRPDLAQHVARQLGKLAREMETLVLVFKPHGN